MEEEATSSRSGETNNTQQQENDEGGDNYDVHIPSGSKRNLVNGRALKKEKQQRWVAKQQRRLQQEQQQQQVVSGPSNQACDFLSGDDSNQRKNSAWIEKHTHFCHLITLKDAQEVVADKTNIHSLHHQWLRPYLDLKNCQQPLSDRNERLFIAEGAETVRLLIRQARSGQPNDDELSNKLHVLSIFVKSFNFFDASSPLKDEVEQLMDVIPMLSGDGQGDETATAASKRQAPFQILLGSEDVLSAVAGFPITRGALACGMVPDWDEAWLMAYLDRRRRRSDATDGNDAQPPASSQLRLLALDAISDTSNMGSMIRCASAFGVDAVILSNDCCDAWYRRAIRVSMGHIFSVPTVRVNDLSMTIQKLAAPPFGVTFYAAVIDPDSEVLLENMEQVPSAWGCVLGNEARGIRPTVVKACHQRVRIDMAGGVDSLSVPIAAGILLHGLREREQRKQQHRMRIDG